MTTDNYIFQLEKRIQLLEKKVDLLASYTATGGGTLTPTASDGAALGSTAQMWSDLFLALGGVINWNNGDVLVTHSANLLAFTGASSGYTFDAKVQVTAGGLYIESNNNSFHTKDLGSIADAGVAAVSNSAGDIAILFVENSSDGTLAIFTLQGAVHATQEMSDPSAKYSITAGTATSANIYWSVGNARYELENKLGSAKTFRVWELANG